jgi:hypothetical protein
MKKYFLLLAIAALNGCATVGKYQQACEATYENFSDMVSCLKSSARSDSRMADNARVRLYLMKADQLVAQVNDKELTETDARLQLQETYLGLKNQETTERDRQTLIQSITKPRTTDTTCTAFGNTANCKTSQY